MSDYARAAGIVFVTVISLAASSVVVAQAPAQVVLAADDVHAKAGIKCEGCHSKPGPDQFAPVGPTAVSGVCGQCHVREAELYSKSPKKIIFEMLQMPACVTCHRSHSVVQPTDTLVGLTAPAVCITCHAGETKGTAAIRVLRGKLDEIAGAIDRASALLDRADVAGMLVEDGRAELRAAQEQQVLSRLALHAFNASSMDPSVKAGVEAATRATAVANNALGELRFRRRGLAVATLLILGFLATLWVKIRRLPPIGD
jgi:predicted CXXCH cytochrome family protein